MEKAPIRGPSPAFRLKVVGFVSALRNLQPNALGGAISKGTLRGFDSRRLHTHFSPATTRADVRPCRESS